MIPRALLLLLALAGSVRAADAPFLWEVQGPAATHYLAGSVHLLSQSAYPLPAALERAYVETRQLVLETDPGALAAPALQREMLDRGVSSKGLRAEVGEPMYARVRKQATQLDVPESVCDAFKPWFCALSLGVLSFRHAGFDPALGVDQHFYRRAMSDRRELRWLESPADQLDLFSTMSEATAGQFLASTLDQLDDPDYRIENLVRQWRQNDVAGLVAMVDQMRVDSKEVHQRLLVQRNLAWMPQLMERFGSTTPALVLVGATHLVGPDGLVAGLKAAGFHPRPVSDADPGGAGAEPVVDEAAETESPPDR